MLTDEEKNVDVCICGTGLTECLLAAALARNGKGLLHLDQACGYGGNWRSHNLKDLEAWASRSSIETEEADLDPIVAPPQEELEGLTVISMDSKRVTPCFSHAEVVWDPFQGCDDEGRKALRESLLKRGHGFNVDLVPRMLFGRSDFVDITVESGVSRYLEFQGLKGAQVLSSEGLLAVPTSKSEIFQDKNLTLVEKRLLMKFITQVSPHVQSLAFQSPAQLGVDRNAKLRGNQSGDPIIEDFDLDARWMCLLKEKKLTPKLQEYLTYGICLWDFAQSPDEVKDPTKENRDESHYLSVREGLHCLGRFISSLGLYGTGMPLLYPMYGTGDVAQAYTRLAALHNGIYALRTPITHLLVEQSPKAEDGSGGQWQMAGLVTRRGEVVRAKEVFLSVDHANWPMPEDGASDQGRVNTYCLRMSVIANQPLLTGGGVQFCVALPGLEDPPLCNVVQILQLDYTTGSCPKDYYVVHFAQAVNGPSPVEGAEGEDVRATIFRDLDVVLAKLLELAGGSQHCLLRCTYIHSPRQISCEIGSPLQECLDGHSLVVTPDPPAVPQFLAGQEVMDAKELFLKSLPKSGAPPTIEDFLPKPVHLVEEERGHDLVELENFNEQMKQGATQTKVDGMLQSHEMLDVSTGDGAQAMGYPEATSMEVPDEEFKDGHGHGHEGHGHKHDESCEHGHGEKGHEHAHGHEECKDGHGHGHEDHGHEHDESCEHGHGEKGHEHAHGHDEKGHEHDESCEHGHGGKGHEGQGHGHGGHGHEHDESCEHGHGKKGHEDGHGHEEK